MEIIKAPQAFPRSEYLRRLAAVKSEMARLDVETLVVNNPGSVAYLSGYTQASMAGYSAQGLVVSIHQEEPTFLTRRCEAPVVHHQSFMAHQNVIAFPESLVGNPSGRDGFDAVIDYLHEGGLANRGLGLESSHMPLERFKARLPDARIVDCSRVVSWIRLVKSDLEIAVMREAAAIADAAMLRAAEVIRPGVREADAVAEIVATLVRGANGKIGTNIAPIYMVTSPRTGAPHIRWSEDVFRDDSQINLELAGFRYGYAAALMRTFSIGAPTDRLRRIHDAEVAGMEVALKTVRPGVTCSDVANAFYRTLGKMGFTKDTRCGYAIGINWVEPTASLQDGDTTVLKPNMTFHLMLGNWIEEDFGYVVSETFRVTDSGAEALTRTPRELIQL